MPTVFRWKGYKFLFFSLDEGEPPHVHVTKGSGQAKFWLADCRLAKSRGFGDMSCAPSVERSKSVGKTC